MENNIMTYDEALRTIEYYKKNAGYPTLKELLNNYATKGHNKYLTDNMKNYPCYGPVQWSQGRETGGFLRSRSHQQLV